LPRVVAFTLKAEAVNTLMSAGNGDCPCCACRA
jgi:hypothetical protein